MTEGDGTGRGRPGDAEPFRDLAARLERIFGGPRPDAPVPRAPRRRERDRERARAVLDRYGLPAHYVPAEYGGALEDYGRLHRLLRTVARRDPAVAASHARTFLAAAPVWVSGDDAAALRIAAPVAAGARVSPGLTGAGAVGPGAGPSAYPTPTGYRVDGDEWLTGGLPGAGFLSLLARTSPVPGPRARSLLLLDTGDLAPGACRPLTAGPARAGRDGPAGAVAFRDARVGAEALAGREGTGVETLLKANQVSWTVLSAISLGAADSALRAALRCAAAGTDGVPAARPRTPGGSRPPRWLRVLTESYADLLLGEALAVVGVRGIHLLTGELSVTSAVVGLLVPSLAAGVLDRQDLLHDTCAPPCRTAAGELARTHSALDPPGGTTLCRSLLAAQFRLLARGYLTPPDHRPRLARLFGLGRSVPPLDPARLTLLSRYGSAVLGTLPLSVARLRELALREPALRHPAALAARLLTSADALHDRIARAPATAGRPSSEGLADARAYALCFAGAACVGLWLGSRPQGDADSAEPRAGAGAAPGAATEALWRDGSWLEACLARVLTHLGAHEPGPADDALFGRLAGPLLTQFEEGSDFSLLPRPTAAREASSC